MVKLINKLKNRKGFTLIELIVVLAVLAIIAAIAVPRFIGVQKTAKIDADYSSGALIAKSAELYYVKGYSFTEIENKLAEDFPQGIDFQSPKLSGKDLGDVDITATSSGGIVVTVDSEQIYPNTGDLGK